MQANPGLDLREGSSAERPDLLIQKSYWLRRFRQPAEQNGLTATWRAVSVHSPTSEFTFTATKSVRDRTSAVTEDSLLSIYAVSLTALAVVLRAHTRSSEIVMATSAGLDSQFMPDAAIPLRINLSSRRLVADLLSSIEEEVAAAYEHCDVCVADLLRTLDFPCTERDPIYSFVAGMDSLHSYCPLDRYQSDLSVRFKVTATTIGATIEYRSALYDSAWIQCFADQWSHALTEIVDHREFLVSEICLQPPSEILASRFPAPAVSTLPVRGTLFERFAKHAGKTPDRIAAVHNKEQLTYQELQTQAERIAEALRDFGASPSTSIAILAQRGFGMLAGMLASLSIGSPYVLIDPDLPPDRIQYYLADCSPIAVVTSALSAREFRSLIVQTSSVRGTVCVDCPMEAKTHGGTHRPGPGSWAYIVYTSGSTGVPKGAIVRHDGALNHILAEIEALGLDHNLRFLQSAPASSDIIMWQILAPLLVGGQTLIADRQTAMDPRSLFQEMKRTRTTLAELVPCMLVDLLDYVSDLQAEERQLPNLRQMMVTGEATDVATFNGWFSLYPNIPLINCFGPAEASDDVCQFLANGPLDSNRLRVPVGTPLANTRIYVLDDSGQLAALCVPGEIHIGGVAVGDGYWNNPRRTAEQFLCDPFTKEIGSRMYRTGDVGRWLPDGNLEFLGRVDNQIKIRGNRIQPDEIESALAAEPGVRRAIVGTLGVDPKHKSLTAWVMLQETNDKAELQDCVSEHVSQWQTVFEDTYSRRARQSDPTFNISGWNSSYTGMPIPAVEMRDWVNTTIQRIGALHPKRVLEIGCGTGLLLLRLASQSEFYCGTDFSPKAIEYVRSQAMQIGLNGPRLDLSVRAADDFEGMKEQFFDTIILNSIIQYFPDENYLIRVLEGAVRLLSPGGTIFVGDIRSLPLLTLHHLSVEVRRASPQTSTQQLMQLVKHRVDREEELVVHPHFFRTLPQRIVDICAVSVLAKRGVFRNELTKFRYDVMLRRGAATHAYSAAPQSDVEWTDELKTSQLSNLTRRRARIGSVVVNNVPDARLFPERQLLTLLEHDGKGTVGDLRHKMTNADVPAGWDPEDLWMEATGAGLDLNWLAENRSGHIDLLIQPEGAASSPSGMILGGKTSERWTNQPLNGRFFERMVPQLRESLARKFPPYMLPSHFVRLESLPLTASGKIDMQALPRPEMTRADSRQAYVAPRTAIQTIITGIWSDLLGVPRIGVCDNFFELGGHSLLATQVVSRIRKIFQIDLPLRSLFAGPTIEVLSGLVEEQDKANGNRAAKLADILLQVKRGS